MPYFTHADEDILPTRNTISPTNQTHLPANTLTLIKELSDLETLDTLLTPIKKEPLVLPSSNCPKPVIIPKKNFMTLITPKSDVSLKNINHESGFDPSYIPDDLVDISSNIKTLGNSKICLSYPAASQLVLMSKEMQRNNLKLSVNSGFRSYYEQQKIHRDYAPYAKNVKYPRVAPPGHSEHQSGLTVDVASELSPGRFALSKESAWIQKNAHLYGFIVSYPENEEEKTGYMYEPWHLRYVGVENAILLHEAKYTLAFKPAYYKKQSLSELLFTLKNKFGFTQKAEIAG